MTPRPTRVAVSVLLAGAVGMAACSDDTAPSAATAASSVSAATSATSPAVESTSPEGTTVVRIGTEEHDDGPTAQLLKEFADEVEQSSNGTVVIEPSFGIVGSLGGGLAWDQHAIELVADGGFDGVVARAGSWHDTGATTLDVLELPGLVDTDAQADQLVSDQSAVDQVMSGLAAAGFTGLGLYPEGPRYLMLLDDSADFSLSALAGRPIRAPLSRTVFDVLSSIGMEPVDLTAADFTVQVPEGTVTSTEGHLARVALTTTVDGQSDARVAVNVPLYTKFLVLALRHDSMPPDVVKVLGAAARTVVKQYLDGRATDVDAAAKACAAGGVLIDVPDADRTAILEAAQPVVDEFVAGPDGALVDVVRNAAGEPSTVAITCRS